MAMDTASEDQRKRTMEALERRFATARAEAHQQMNRGKKRSLNGGEKEMHSANSSAIASSLHLSDTPVANSPNVSSKKGWDISFAYGLKHVLTIEPCTVYFSVVIFFSFLNGLYAS